MRRDKVLITAEEDRRSESAIRADPGRTMIPGLIVNAVVEVPFGAHPSYAYGLYDRDNIFYQAWDAISAEPSQPATWLDEWVFGVGAPRRVLGEARAGCPRSSRAIRELTVAASWTASELMVVNAARLLQDGDVVLVGVGTAQSGLQPGAANPRPRTGDGLRIGGCRQPAVPPAAVHR